MASASARRFARSSPGGRRPVALGQPPAVGVQHQRHVAVARLVQAQQPRDQQLARRGVQQVVAAHHLADRLVGVVDDHRQVVGVRAVPAAQRDVVDGRLHLAVHQVGERHGLGARVQAQRRRPVRGALLLGPLGGGQLAAGAGVGALGQRPVRRLRGLPDLGPRAPARVHPALRLQPRQRVGVQLVALGLAHRLLVPVDPHGPQVGQLPRLVLAPGPLRVQVLDPQQEPRAQRARTQPGHQRGAQVARVQRARGAGGEAAVV